MPTSGKRRNRGGGGPSPTVTPSWLNEVAPWGIKGIGMWVQKKKLGMLPGWDWRWLQLVQSNKKKNGKKSHYPTIIYGDETNAMVSGGGRSPMFYPTVLNTQNNGEYTIAYYKTEPEQRQGGEATKITVKFQSPENAKSLIDSIGVINAVSDVSALSTEQMNAVAVARSAAESQKIADLKATNAQLRQPGGGGRWRSRVKRGGGRRSTKRPRRGGQRRSTKWTRRSVQRKSRSRRGGVQRRGRSRRGGGW